MELGVKVDSLKSLCHLSDTHRFMEVIQFHCPICRILLRVPASSADVPGPCPACGKRISAPPRASDPFQPFPATAAHEPAPPVSVAPLPELVPTPGPPGPAAPQTPTPEGDPRPYFRRPPEPVPAAPFSEPEPAPSPAPPSEPEPIPAAPDPLPEATPLPPEDVWESPPTAVPVPRLAETEEQGMFTSAHPTPASPSSPFKPETPGPSTASESTPDHPRTELPALGRLRWAVLILASLLFFLIGLVTGQLLALRGNCLAAPIFRTTPAPASEATDLPAPDAAPTLPPLISPPPPSEPPSTPDPAEIARPDDPIPRSREILEAFLDAPTWEKRLPHVLDPDRLRERMQQHAAETGDGPIAYTGIEGPVVAPGLHRFDVTTPALPRGFPVTLFQQGEDWKIDWDMFREFHDDAFRHFAAGTGGDEGSFHLFVKPDDAGNENYRAYQLTAPIEGRSYVAFAKRGSLAAAKLDAVFSNEADQESPVFQQMLRGVGIPVVLQLTTRRNGEGQRFLLIEDLLARYWGPES